MRDNPVAWLLVGALLGGLINAAVRQYATFKEGKAIALAIRGEISGIIEIVLKRRYLQHLERSIHQLSNPSYQLSGHDFFHPGFLKIISRCLTAWLIKSAYFLIGVTPL